MIERLERSQMIWTKILFIWIYKNFIKQKGSQSRHKHPIYVINFTYA